MPRLRSDVIANLLGQGWAVLVGLLFVPFFLGQLGAERFALIALLPVATALTQVLDFGLAVTLNRQLARSLAADAGSARATAITLGALHLAIGAVVCALALGLGATVGPAWLNAPAQMGRAEFERAVLLLAIAAVLQWPLPLFQNGMMGLGRQARVNALLAVHATVANAGAALLVLSLDATLTVYLIWFAACAAVHTAVAGCMLWRALPAATGRVRFDPALLRSSWQFSGGAAGIGITGVLLIHADRLIASRLLTLEQFGYYGVASTIGRSLYLLIAPVYSAVFPRLSGLVAQSDVARAAALYSSASQLMAFAIAPPAAVIFWLGFDAAHAWLGSTAAAQAVAALAAALALGSMFNGFMNLPYARQLAHGVTRIGLGTNLLLLAVSLPAAFALHGAFGAVGVASTWLVINVLYFAVGTPLTHYVLRVPGAAHWALVDVLPPTIAAFAIAGAFHAAVGAGGSRIGSGLLVGTALVLSYASALLVAPAVRREAVALVRRLTQRPRAAR